ncbi:MAG: hypothetical protein QOH61_761 [Chloroflexota bacterium]|nr:hypothetical protein [Chloroflexota bacterium]
MRRALLSLALAASLVMAVAAPVGAVSANIAPATQTHSHNVLSHWTGSWTGRANFDTLFWYGDGTGVEVVTANLNRAYSHLYSPCPGDPTNYFQLLEVYDNIGHGSSLYASSTSSTHENSGTPC